MPKPLKQYWVWVDTNSSNPMPQSDLFQAESIQDAYNKMSRILEKMGYDINDAESVQIDKA